MKERTLEQKALLVIERLVSDDLSDRLEYDAVMARELTATQDDLKMLANKLSAIYRISHAARETICHEVHDDWRQEMEERYRQLEG